MNKQNMNRNKTTTHGSKVAMRLPCLLVLLALIGCRRDETEIPMPTGDAVLFRTETIDDFATRSAGYTTNGPNSLLSMSIFAAHTSNPWTAVAPINFMTDQKVERTHAGAPWLYEPEQYWPGSGYVSFFGYAPHSTNAVWNGVPPSLTATNGIPSLSYSIAPTHDKQVDLLVSTPVKDQTKRDYITIPLRHALTKIAFSARVANEPDATTTYKVTKIELKKLHNTGSLDMDGSNRSWTPAVATANYEQTIDNNGIKDIALTATYQLLTPGSGHLFLLPQTLDTDATVVVTYTSQAGAAAPEVKTKELKLSLAISQWRPGEAYNLMFTIDNGVTFIVAPTPWDNTEVQADIKNRILNVTRIEANVYPGVATRIYFWCNQPKDSVYVRENGNIDNAKYPTGLEYTINNLFQSLSGAAAVNLHYPGFDGISTPTGEGYIDVLMKDKTTVPYLPELSDGDKHHIWLNASGLNRNILLNSIVRGNLTTTPYVGTFHRWNETGERIVTWGYNDNWTVTVDTEAGASDEVRMDALSSPFMATGQLYGSGNVGDPETTQLSSAATSAVSGTGRVYFRVGWKTRLANRTQTRYARIKATGPNIGGSGINTIFLYLRQGEADDYLYENNGAEGVKWNPYNLTVEGLSAGGSVQIALNRTNARFVQYPTQAGGIYKWINPDPAVRPTVYSPVGTISGWTVMNYNGFWYPVLSQQESCPPGYRRPNRGSISASVPSGTTVNAEILHSLFEEIDYNSGTNKPSNSLWGYYADGFFDRRNIESATGGLDGGTACAVEASSVTVGYIGRLFYNPTGLTTRAGGTAPPIHSLFFPAAGYRSDQKQHKDGVEGHYWSSSGETRGSNTLGWNLVTGAGTTANAQTSDLYGMSVRCVRDIGFATDLTPDTEVVVPTALTYNAYNAGINGLFVSEWVNIVAQAITTLPTGTNLRAKVTFTGSAAIASSVAPTASLLDATTIAKGSTVTFDFTQVTFSTNSKLEISVESTDWEYSIFNSGIYVQGGGGKVASINAAIPAANRGVVLRRR